MTELNTITEKLSFIQKTLSVKKNQKNNFGKYNYRTAEDIYTSFKEIVNKCNLNVSLITDFSIQNIESRIFLKCEASLQDKKDEKITATSFAELGDSKKGMDIAQLTGATQTYARKYALQSLLAIDDKEMDLDSQEIKEKEQKALIQEKGNLVKQLEKYINDEIMGKDGEMITKEKILETKKVDDLSELDINDLKNIIKILAGYWNEQKNNKQDENI